MSRRTFDPNPPHSSSGGYDQPHRSSSASCPAQHGPTATSNPSTTAASPPMQRGQPILGFGFELPPLPQVPGAGGQNFSPPSMTRLAGVSSILNPSHVEEPGQGRRRKASEIESPRGTAASLPLLAANVQSGLSISGRPDASAVGAFGGPAERPPRRILTPRSPLLHRAASLSQLQPSAATISAQQMPFPGSPRHRTYAVAPGTSGAPPLPTPPAAMRNVYGFPAPTPPSEAARRASSGATRETRATSGSTSPTTSYSSYSQGGQTSPAAQYVPMTTGGLSYGSGAANAPVGIPISSSGGQNTYQMMTLETTSGTVHLPVDVQAASRVADEKRRRNAGASARFRRRRKEKEKEASVTIGKLEQQLKDYREDAEFYRREREYLSGILLQTPGGDRHFPRPPSPRRRRSSSALPGPSGTAGTGFAGGQETVPRSPGQERNVRRRTSTLSLPPPPPPQTVLQPAGRPYQPGYGMQAYGTSLAPQPILQQQRTPGPLPAILPRHTLPPPTALPSIQPAPPPGPPQLMQAQFVTGPWNPYAADRRPQGQSGPRDSRSG